MFDFRPRRSVLYLPAIRESAVAKARTLDCDCDCVLLDLEDAVAPDRKDDARLAAVAAIAAGGWGHRELLVRVNGVGTRWAEADFAAARGAGAAALVVPKIDSAGEAARAVTLAAGTPLWAMIETPRAVIEAPAIAATPGVTGLVAGFADLATDLRLRPDAARSPLHYAMGAIVFAARAAQILAFDGVFTDIHDPDGLQAEAAQARMFGFDGKTLIHPSQVYRQYRVRAVGRRAGRRPWPDRRARGGDGRGQGRHHLRGKLVEILHVAAAHHLLATARTIVAR